MSRGFDGSVKIDTALDSKGFNTGVQGIGGSLKGLLSTISKVGAAIVAAFSVALIVKFGTEALKTASEFLRMKLAAQQVGQMFGWTSTEVTDMEQTLIKLGIQTDIANRGIIDFAREGLDKTLLPALARGAQDLALFGREGETSSDMFDRLVYGIMTFNPLILRTAGVAVDVEESFKAWAKTNGRTAESMTTVEKRAVTLNAVLAKLTGVSGLYEISQKTSAGQMQSNIRLMTELQAAIGMPFQDSLFTIVKGFNDLIKAMTAAIQPGGKLYGVMTNLAVIARWLSEMLVGLFRSIATALGITVQPSKTVSLIAEKTADNLQDAANSAGELGDNLKDAARIAKGALAAFDQLNVLAQAGENDTGGGGIPLPTIPPVDTTPLDNFDDAFEAFKARIEEIKAKILETLRPITEAFDRLVVALTPLGKTIWEGLKWAWDNILVPLGKWVFTELLPKFLDLLGGAAAVVDSALKALKPIWTWFWDKVLEPLAKWTAQAVLDVLEWLTDRLYELSDWIDKNPEAFRLITAGLLILGAAVVIVTGALTAWIGISALATAATTAFGAAVAFVTSPVMLVILAVAALIAAIILIIHYWPEISAAAEKAWGEIVRVWNIVADWFKKNVIDPLEAFWKPVFEFIGILAHNAWLVIKRVWEIVSGWFQTNVIDPVSKAFATLWDGIEVVWGAVSKWFETNVVDPLKKIFKPVLDWLLETWTKIFTGIQDVAKGLINGILGFINGLIRGVVQGVNTIIGALNSVGQQNVPGWITIPSIVAPQIPLLAEGAVIPPNSRFLAMLGDQKSGRNIEAPEDLIRQIVREESGGAGREITINFAGSLSSLMRELKPYADVENGRIGASLVKVGVS